MKNTQITLLLILICSSPIFCASGFNEAPGKPGAKAEPDIVEMTKQHIKKHNGNVEELNNGLKDLILKELRLNIICHPAQKMEKTHEAITLLLDAGANINNVYSAEIPTTPLCRLSDIAAKYEEPYLTEKMPESKEKRIILKNIARDLVLRGGTCTQKGISIKTEDSAFARELLNTSAEMKSARMIAIEAARALEQFGVPKAVVFDTLAGYLGSEPITDQHAKKIREKTEEEKIAAAVQQSKSWLRRAVENIMKTYELISKSNTF